MSYKLTHDALHAPNCKGGTKLVLIALADFANEKTGLCYPAHATIAKTIGCSRRAVVSAITDLEKLGYIRRGPKHGLSLSYSFAIPSTCEKSSHNREDALCKKSSHNHQSEPVKNLHRGCEKSSQGDVKILHTNREDRIENNNKESNKQASNSIMNSNIGNPTPFTEKPQTEKPKMQTTPQAPTPQATPAAACRFALIDIGLAALARLKADGIDEKEAKRKLSAVSKEFKAEAIELRDGGYSGISNPKAYLVAKLVGMAKEGPKQATPQAEEPTRLEEIFELLKKEWAVSYPEVADKIKSFELIDLHPSTENELRAKEDADWKTVKCSRIAYVRSTLKATVFERVQAWRQDELKEVSSCLQRVTSKLARLRFEPKAYYDPRKTVEDEIAELEEREKKCRAKLDRLNACATRPNAA